MAETLNCEPCYDGRPDYDPSLGTAILPKFDLSRSRLFAGGTFFRSKLGPGDTQSGETNNIALEVVNTALDEMTLYVYYNNIEVESYAVFQDDECTAGGDPPPPPAVGINVGIPSLRTATASSAYITMPARTTDAQDPCELVLFVLVCPSDAACLSVFAKTNMTGGDGLPLEAEVPAIRTGPDRTFVFIDSKEDANGFIGDPGPGENLNQWNFDTSEWTSYVIDADCALPDNRCP